MAKGSYILALDQGTTSSRAILFDGTGRAVARGQRAVTQHYPEPGWVEHDADEIWTSEWQAIQDCLGRAGVDGRDIAAIGIANQRETTVLWDKRTGAPVARAVVWQCRRTADLCARLGREGWAGMFRERTGLMLDPYFSGTKVAWLLNHLPGVRARAERGEIAFGTVDSWLIYKLTGGQAHITDVSNASRTLLFNLHSLAWDEELLRILDIPRAILPLVVPSVGVVAETASALFGRSIPIAGLAGDQSAALFGQGCLKPGMAKNTYGTGSFLLMNSGSQATMHEGLVTSVAWATGDGATYALEGSIFITGAVVQWLRDELHIISEAEDTASLALSVPDSGGVYLVPAFTGLGSPYWDPYARGTIVGITRGTSRAHLVRAALESIAYQTRDVVEAMIDARHRPLEGLRVDGGAMRNPFLAQFQADILGCPIERAKTVEITAWGAAGLAGVGSGWWPEPPAAVPGRFDSFVPAMAESVRNQRYARWKDAVARSRAWEPTNG
jgi:glycerol kinase